MLNKDNLCIEAILEAISKIKKYTRKHSNHDEFYIDSISFEASMMNFVVIGEMVAKISEKFKNTSPQIQWTRIKGFRNIVTHDYFGIDPEEVWQIIENDLPVLEAELKSLIT